MGRRYCERMRFVVCGENLIDLIPKEAVSTAETHWAAFAGGGPFNTSVALARLGEDTEFLGRIGADGFGSQVAKHLESAGVGMGLAVRADEPTSLAVVSLDEEGRAQYHFHLEGTAGFSWRRGDFPQLTDSDWLHFGSIGCVTGSGTGPLLEFIRSTPAAVSYDLNIRPTVIPDRARYWDMVEPLMAAVGEHGGIIRASDEDITWLVDDEDFLPHAQAWMEEYGLALFVITLGPDGAVALKPSGQEIRVPGRQVDVVDTVGAGDTFMAGFLSAYVDNPSDIEAALRRGIAAAALVCQRRGPNPPTMAEVRELLA